MTSSAKKIARLAEKSKTRSPRGIRLRGGSLFPTVIIVVLALGAALVSGKPGVVEWQPQVLSGQRRARLSAVLDLYAIEVSDDSITFPASINGGTTLTESTEACDGKGGSLFVDTWDVEGTDPSRKTSIASLGSVRLNNDGLAVALVFAPDGTEVDQPPAASEVALLVNSGE